MRNGKIIFLIFILIVSIAAFAAAQDEKTIPLHDAEGPGPQVFDKELERRTSEALRKLVRNDVDVSDYVSDILFICPALYKHLSRDNTIKDLGIPTKVHTAFSKEPLVARTYATRKEIAALFKSETFRDMLRWVSHGATKTANARERAVFYSLIPYEIYDHALVIMQNFNEFLLFDYENDKISYICMLSSYMSKEEQQSEGEGQADPTALLGINLVTDEYLIEKNIDRNELVAYIEAVDKAILGKLKSDNKIKATLIVTLSLYKDKEPLFRISVDNKLDDQFIEELDKKMRACQPPSSISDDISLQLKYRMNNK